MVSCHDFPPNISIERHTKQMQSLYREIESKSKQTSPPTPRPCQERGAHRYRDMLYVTYCGVKRQQSITTVPPPSHHLTVSPSYYLTFPCTTSFFLYNKKEPE